LELERFTFGGNTVLEETIVFKRRRLIRALRQADKKRDVLRASENEDDYDALYEIDRKIDNILLDIDALDQRTLKRAAYRFGIPFRRVGFDEWLKVKEGGGNPKALDNLSFEESAALRRKIADARFAYWKKWAELLIPILSLLIAIIALLKK
jgi:hypothetical protein